MRAFKPISVTKTLFNSSCNFSVSELANRMEKQLIEVGILPNSPSKEQKDLLLAATPLVHERLETLSQVPGMLSFLFVEEKDFVVDHEDAEKSLTHDILPALDCLLYTSPSPRDS